MLFVYPAIFHKDDNAYWVEFPDLEGCQSFGNTVEETMGGAQEALAAYILTVLEGGAKLPTPSEIKKTPLQLTASLLWSLATSRPIRTRRQSRKP